jgi:FtsP/CotA-like multicopper oxidase with cupredoxin domain
MFSSCRFPAVSNLMRGLIVLSLSVLPFGGVTRAVAQTSASQPSKSSIRVGSQPVAATTNTTPTPQRMRGTTNAQRKAAAATSAIRRSRTAGTMPRVHANAIVGTPGNPAGPATLDQLYFSGVYPNYANSPLPNVADTVNCSAPNYCGLRKFVDTLPLPNQANDLGNMLPVAVPDTTTFPGSDYYEISLVQYRQQLHKDLPAVQGTWPNQTGGGTLLRGYVQTNGPNGPNRIPNYLGPIIVAQSNRPVRVKFTNALPTGTAGNLFIPTDLTSMGAGLGLASGSSPYLQNRATIHMHGGNTPWISDGTPHQWTIPAGDWGTTLYERGDSVAFVPDMFFVDGAVVPQCSATVTTNCSDPTGTNNATTLPAGATNDPGHGSLTFYYTNQQSARLLFYHDHSYGTTRLNVYAGEAGAMVIRDQAETDLTTGTNLSGVFTKAGVVPAPAIPSGDAEIPLVIQDKTFVPQNPVSTTVSSITVLAPGEGYTTATVGFTGGCSVEPVATASIGLSIDGFGQFIYGAITGITMTSAGSGCTSDPVVTITGDGTTPAAAFASVATLSQQDPTWDSALWGGYGNLWYPHVYMPNQWPGNPDGSSSNPMGRWDYASWFWPAFTNQYTVRGELPCPTAYDATMTCPGTPSALAPAPTTEADGTTVHLGQGSTVSLTPEGFMDTPIVNGVPYPTMTVDPKPYRFRILSVANERTFNLSWFLACGGTQYTATAGATCPTPTVAGIAPLTEVGMVPAVTTAGFPVWYPSDGRDGGVPDPAAMGPSWYQIGTEGGVLPNVAVIPPTPVTYEQSLRSVTVTNIKNHGLLLMSAERADAIVDFTPYAGKTLILYNDAPAPTPAYDVRNDYYTGDPDNTGTGGAPSTLAGFGPNTRTIMQVVVRGSIAGGAATPLNVASLNALVPAAFNLTQPVPVVPEPAYNKAYLPAGQTFKSTYPALQSTAMTFQPIDPATKLPATVVTNGVTGPLNVTLPLRNKTIQELFELDYGRMNATLGTELPLTNFNTQTTIPLGYIDPFTEDTYDSANVAMKPVGTAGDGSQLWMIIHNGVDSHAIHFHLFDVQLINRYGWDGTNRVPFPDELGWKDTVRMNPLEIDFVALRPMSQTLPFPVPDSTRLFDVTRPAGPDPAMSAFDPLNNAAPQMNVLQPMGWEYVWHCHLLGHEENDMMRETVFQVPPQTPLNVKAVALSGGNQITFTDMSLSETGFTVQRATNSAFTAGLRNLTANANPGWNNTVTYLDTNATRGTSYYYRVQSFKPDADYWMPLIGTAGNPTALPKLVSGWSNSATLTVSPILQLTPTALNFGPISSPQTSASQQITVQNVGVGSLGITSMRIVAGANPNSFSVTGNTCTTTLAPGASCTVTIVLKSTVVGSQSASFTVVSNAPGNGTQSVALTGLVTGPLTITASSATMNWGAAIPMITPIVVGLAPPDTIASLAITCSTTYTVTSLAGTYPTNCVAGTNPLNKYTITYVPGKLTVNPVAVTMISPAPGTQLPGTTVTFNWTTGGTAGPYVIWVSDLFGQSDLYVSGHLTTPSATVTTIPTTGKTIYVRLFTWINGAWQTTDYTYTAPPPVANPAKAVLTSPTTGPITSSPVTFQWTKGNGVNLYQLWVSTVAPGGSEVYHSAYLATTSVSVPVPINKTLYVRLASNVNGQWQIIDYVF